jgi:hypothetical protein
LLIVVSVARARRGFTTSVKSAADERSPDCKRDAPVPNSASGRGRHGRGGDRQAQATTLAKVSEESHVPAHEPPAEMAALAWETVITGTSIVYPWYRDAG